MTVRGPKTQHMIGGLDTRHDDSNTRQDIIASCAFEPDVDVPTLSGPGHGLYTRKRVGTGRKDKKSSLFWKGLLDIYVGAFVTDMRSPFLPYPAPAAGVFQACLHIHPKNTRHLLIHI